jgi:hypothetical protein
VCENTRGIGQYRDEWQHSAYTQDFCERGENHQDKQNRKLPTAAIADMLPKVNQQFSH